MNDTLTLLLAYAVGGTLGIGFFGGLWWTVRKGVSSRQPALWFFGSMLLRMGLALLGFYVVAGGRWERLLVCLVGFIMARPVVIWLTRRSTTSAGEDCAAQEANHAPYPR